MGDLFRIGSDDANACNINEHHGSCRMNRSNWQQQILRNKIHLHVLAVELFPSRATLAGVEMSD